MVVVVVVVVVSGVGEGESSILSKVRRQLYVSIRHTIQTLAR